MTKVPQIQTGPTPPKGGGAGTVSGTKGGDKNSALPPNAQMPKPKG